MTRELHGRFPLNPLADEEVPFFPEHCLGAGCARWAAKVAIEFVLAFYSVLNIEDGPKLLFSLFPSLRPHRAYVETLLATDAKPGPSQ